jgi:hypothetical protein
MTKGHPAVDTTTAQQLTVEDRLAISDLYAAQAHFIDGGDASGWAGTFTEEGSFTSPTYGLTAVGRPALTDFAAKSNSGALERGDQLRHWMGNVLLEPDGRGGARATAYMLIVATSAAGSRIDRSLRVFDELAKVGSQWLVATRIIRRDG